MSVRPASVSIIGCLLAIRRVVIVMVGLYGLFTWDDLNHEPFLDDRFVPNNLAGCVEMAGAVVGLVCGVHMLKAENWARWLYAVTSGGFILFDWWDQSAAFPELLAGTTLQVLFNAFLFLPQANAYFLPRKRRGTRYRFG